MLSTLSILSTNAFKWLYNAVFFVDNIGRQPIFYLSTLSTLSTEIKKAKENFSFTENKI